MNQLRAAIGTATINLFMLVIYSWHLNAAAPPTAFLYESYDQTNGFKINDSTGVPTAISPTPVAGAAAAADPSGRFLYTADGAGLHEYLIDATSGVLTVAPGSPFSAIDPQTIAIGPNGRFLYAVSDSSSDGAIVGYSIDAVSGELTSTGPATVTSTFPEVLAVDPSGLFLYSASGQIFSIDQTNGSLTQAGTFGAGFQLLFNPSGSRLYVSAGGGSVIDVYSVNASTGLLTSVQSFSYSGSEYGAPLLAIDPEDRFLYAVTTEYPFAEISGYYINPKTGALESQITGSPFSGPEGLAGFMLDSSGKFLYAVSGYQTIAVYSRNASSGSLTPIAGSPFAGQGDLVMTLAPKFTPITATLTGLSVSPSTASIVSAQPGITAQFLALGQYSDGVSRFLTSSAEWSSSDASVATVSNSPGSQGLATTAGVGQTTLTASYGGFTGNATLSVSAAPLSSITVTPANLVVKPGVTPQMTATGTYSDGTQQNLTDLVTWVSSSTAVATISSTGLATAVANGNTVISASQGSITGKTNLDVR